MVEKDLYATIVGLKNYERNKLFKIESIVRLVKEPDNDSHLEAIACENRYIGKTGYIANCANTITKGTMSAGRIYNKIGDISYCEVKYLNSFQIILNEIIKSDVINKTGTIYNSSFLISSVIGL